MDATALHSLPFRFDRLTHQYTVLDTGEIVPHITQLLERAGLSSEMWMTAESAERGTQVHAMTADYDLGAIENPHAVTNRYKGYLLAHVSAMQIVRPKILAVEEPMVHPRYRFGGRTDREIQMGRLISVMEGKSGPPERHHQIQTALQAILVAPKYHLPPESMGRFCLYWKRNGKWKLEEHTRRQDFAEARQIIREHC